ncbi:MAG: ABC transporter ATP-binding protein [Clostridia bacterium]|nr:ABC transporter ATP-binding protein [Clostridia bacterium]
MNAEYAIDVRNATVRFNMASEKTDNLKEYFVKLAQGKLRFDEFLALQDVTLQVKKGEAWGIIGDNGAGKSTLLKLVCGVVSPYRGTASLNGTVAPMIELSAGMDPNLTARENIYLNGTILGYRKKFIESKFDDIVTFAEIERFLDIPIKNYSSGMRARLGFAVATIVQPEVLIVDEILAVGDVAFQRKCKDRMREMLSGGTTLLLVSHSLRDVTNLCAKALWLENGRTRMTGEAYEVVNRYLATKGAAPLERPGRA